MLYMDETLMITSYGYSYSRVNINVWLMDLITSFSFTSIALLTAREYSGVNNNYTVLL